MAKSTYTVERSTRIQAPAAEVFQRINDLKAWQAWSPWEGLDPELGRDYTGPDAGVGAGYSWRGNRKVGEGNMTITESVQDQKLELDLHFLKPFKADSRTIFDITPAGEGACEVRWTMIGENTLMSRIIGIFMPMDKMIGKDFEKGLSQLEALFQR
jgi:hypothetical protein